MGLYSKMQFFHMGDRGLLLEFGDEISQKINEKVRRMALAIQSEAIPGILETVPTYRSLLVLYDPLSFPQRFKERTRIYRREDFSSPLFLSRN